MYESPKEGRCKCIHDPRVAGEEEWWLPQKHILPSTKKDESDSKPPRPWETKGFHLDFFQYDSFVTSHYPLGLKELAEDFENPVDNPTKISVLWERFCSTVCNLEDDHLLPSRTPTTILTEAQKLSMVLQVIPHKYDSDSHYLYRPTHTIYNENCMLVSTCAFDVSSAGPPRKIKEDSYDSSNKYHYKVRHIVFGPRSGTGKRQASIWFDIPDEEIHLEDGPSCRIATKSVSSSPMTVMNFPHLNNVRKSFTDASSLLEKPFVLKLLAHDKQYFQLVLNVLKWRMTCLYSNDHSMKANKAIVEDQSLKETFVGLLTNWVAINSWPINSGRAVVTPETLVPLANSEYRVPEASPAHNFYSNVWGPFVTEVSQD